MATARRRPSTRRALLQNQAVQSDQVKAAVASLSGVITTDRVIVAAGLDVCRRNQIFVAVHLRALGWEKRRSTSILPGVDGRPRLQAAWFRSSLPAPSYPTAEEASMPPAPRTLTDPLADPVIVNLEAAATAGESHTDVEIRLASKAALRAIARVRRIYGGPPSAHSL